MKGGWNKFLLSLVLAFGVVCSGLGAGSPLQAKEWKTLVDDTRLSFTGADGEYPGLGVDSSGNIHIAWQNLRDGNWEIYYTKLDNNGNTVLDDTRLTASGSDSTYPSLGLDSSGNIHIAWQDLRDGNWEIYYTKLDNNGNTVLDDTRLTFTGNNSRYPSLGVDSSGNIHIAWEDLRDGNWEIYYTRLDNNGNTVVDDTRLTADDSYSAYPSLGLDDSGNVHIAWEDLRDGTGEIYYAKLDNNGNTVVDDTRLTADSSYSAYPSLGVDSAGNVHIAWYDRRDGNREIYYTKLDNNGYTVVDDTRLTSDKSDSRYPSLGLDSSGNVHIAWHDYRDAYYPEIYYTRLDNNGNTVVDDTRLTSDKSDSRYPSLGVDSAGNVHIAWYDRRDGNREIYYTKVRSMTDRWKNLVDDTGLTSAGSDSRFPSLGVDSSGNVYIAWQDLRDGNREIYYTKLDNNGNPVVDDSRLTSDDSYSAYPSLGLDSSGNIHIAWYDRRDGNREIYYAKAGSITGKWKILVDDTRLTSEGSDSRYPSLGLDNSGNIHIAWQDYRDGAREIYYTKLDNNGNTVVDDTRLTASGSDSAYPSLGLDSAGNVHIAWQALRDGVREIYYTKLDNNGNTVVDDSRLTSDNFYSAYPSLGVDNSGNVHIAWYDRRDGNREIYYTKLDNNGNTVVDDTGLTSTGGDSRYPSLGLDSAGNVYIAWQALRDGNWEIYYTKLDNNGNTVVDDTGLSFTGADGEYPSLGVDSSGNIHIAWQNLRDDKREIYYAKLDNNGNIIIRGENRSASSNK